MVGISGHTIVDSGYSAQLLAELNSGRVTQVQVDALTKKYEEFRERSHSHDIVIALGSARRHVPQPNQIRFMECFCNANVDREIAFGTGHGRGGWMLEGVKAHVKAWRGDMARAVAAPLIGVPLLFQGPSTEQKLRVTEVFPEIEWLNVRENRRKTVICSPPHMSLRTRTHCLFAHKRIRAQIFCEGGWGTTEELGTSGVDFQLWDGIASAFNHTVFPPQRIFLDTLKEVRGRKVWFYEGMRMHLNNMHDFGDVDRKSTADIRIIRLGEGDDEVHESGVEVHHFSAPEAAAEYAHSLVMNNTERERVLVA